MRTSSRIGALLLFDEVELLDVAAALGVLSNAGRQWNWRPFKVHVVARTPGAITTRSQTGLVATEALEACSQPEILIVPGGYGARRAADDSEVVAWLKGAAAAAELVLVVGSGVVPLARAGGVGTARIAVARDLCDVVAVEAPAARLDTETPWLADGKLISARGGAAAVDASLALVARTIGEKQARGVAELLGSEWQPAPPAEVIRVP